MDNKVRVVWLGICSLIIDIVLIIMVIIIAIYSETEEVGEIVGIVIGILILALSMACEIISIMQIYKNVCNLRECFIPLLGIALGLKIVLIIFLLIILFWTLNNIHSSNLPIVFLIIICFLSFGLFTSFAIMYFMHSKEIISTQRLITQNHTLFFGNQPLNMTTYPMSA